MSLVMLSSVRILGLGFIVAVLVGMGCHALAQDKTVAGWRGSADALIDRRYGPGGIYGKIPERDEFGRDQLAMFREWNPDPVRNHDANLRALNPVLARVVRKAQADNPDLHFVIGSGRRDDRMQRKAFAWGWSRTRDSRHQSGDAIDLWPLSPEGQVDFDPGVQNRVAVAMKKAASELGVPILWGGHFHGFKHLDRSHFELVGD
jgi:hypothetical protein